MSKHDDIMRALSEITKLLKDMQPEELEPVVGYISPQIGYTSAPNYTIGTGTTGATFNYSITPAPTPLFGSWIKKTKTLQEEFFNQKFEDFDQKRLEDWIRVNVLAAEDELHEALAEVSWKPWASSEYFNRDAFLGEIVDALHFVANLLAGAGITDEELNTAYLAKMERNRKRQSEGYTGLDKCSICKRAADDVAAHGGTMGFDDQQNPVCDSCWSWNVGGDE